MTLQPKHLLTIEQDPDWGYDRIQLRASAPRGDEPVGTPLETVRIFLGTEPSQWQAERVFLWSISRFGSPRRSYEIHRMADLHGFDTRNWTTGFTNYRFAIPDFARGRGRAIYNDVDQVYLADPGRLYDLDLGAHGFLARSDSETSVMLLDCERMRSVWNHSTARARTKKALHASAKTLGGSETRGPLPSEWNARDSEHDAARPGVLHFTTLHTQPWRPFPLQFLYEPHPHEALWHRLEAEADTAGFELYTQQRPSARFENWRRARVAAMPFPEQPMATLASACGVEKREILDAPTLRTWLGESRRDDVCEGLGCEADWARLPPEDLGWVLEALLRAAKRLLVLVDRSPDPASARILESRLERAAARHPDVTWHFRSETHLGPRVRNGGPAAAQQRGEAPAVWVLRDDRGGNTTQSVGVAQALGWPWQEKQLVFDQLGRAAPSSLAALAPPWPDLVLAAGERSAPVAKALRERAHGLPRLVQLGRKGGADADPFDLVVTPTSARLWPDPKRLETTVPVCREADTTQAPIFGDLPGLRVGLLVGGSTGRLTMDLATVRELANKTRALLAPLDATLWVSTSRRSPADAADCLARELPDAHIYTWRGEDPSNPYSALLAEAEVLIVTGESESMLAEAAATHAALVIAPIGRTHPPTLRQRVGQRIVAHGRRRPQNERGTPLPQRGLVRWCARLIATGRVRPLRDLDAMQHGLVELGRAHFLDEVLREPTRLQHPVTPFREAGRVAARVRALFAGEPRVVTGATSSVRAGPA